MTTQKLCNPHRRLCWYTNNAFDTIAMYDGKQMVNSWTDDAMDDFVDAWHHPATLDDWDAMPDPDNDPNLSRPSDDNDDLVAEVTISGHR